MKNLDYSHTYHLYLYTLQPFPLTTLETQPKDAEKCVVIQYVAKLENKNYNVVLKIEIMEIIQNSLKTFKL